MRTEAFVIHLARAAGRRPQAERLLAALLLPATLLDAVDGRALDAAAIASVYQPTLHRPRYPFPLRATEVAVFLSHRKAWRAIVAGGLGAGLIVEDDVAPEPSFPMALALALREAKPGDYLRLPFRARTDAGRVMAQDGAVTLVEPTHAGLGMQAQLVTREAARRLLLATERFDRPVDALVQMRWLTGVRVLAVRPPAIREIGGELGGTLTQKTNKGWAEILSREVKRALYRARLRWRDPGPGA